MTKSIRLTFLSGLIAILIAGCGPSEEEQQRREQARQDSLEQVRQDSLQQLRQQRQDSLEKARADSLAQARQDQTKITNVSFTQDGQFAVQVESWRSEYKAEQQAQKWRERGFENAFVVEHGNKQTGDIWYRVRLGRVDSRQEAQSLVEQLKDKYQTESWVSMVN